MASGQKGLITTGELLEAGLSRSGIKRRLAKGFLHRQYDGVYSVGHDGLGVEARYLAAVLACGEGAALSGRAAGHLFQLLPGQPPPPEVTSTRNRQIAGITTHRVRALPPTQVAVHRGIPVTTIPRTVVDLAAALEIDDLGLVCHRAQTRHPRTRERVLELLGGRPNAKGASKLREIFEGDHRVTLSELERRFLALLVGAGLPLPQTNVDVDSFSVDCRWPGRMLTVELDSYRYHNSRRSWQRDRRREREAWNRGDEFRRYTWTDVTEDEAGVVAEVGLLLGR